MADITDQLRYEIEQLKAERSKLAQRIHNQRVALRRNWEIIESRAAHRRAWVRSPLLVSMLHRHWAKKARPPHHGIEAQEG